MIHNMARSITAFLLHKDIVKDDFEIYEYGMEVLISSFLGVIIILILSGITGLLMYGIIFLIMFVLIRMYTGGYHADSYVMCNLTFVTTFAVSIVILYLCKVYSFKWNIWLINIFSFMCIVDLAPVDNHNKILDDLDKRHYKTISAIIYIVVMLIVLFVDILGEYSNIAAYTSAAVINSVSLYIKIILNIIAVLMYIGELKEKKYIKNCGKERA